MKVRKVRLVDLGVARSKRLLGGFSDHLLASFVV